jgi:hypothetical protein
VRWPVLQLRVEAAEVHVTAVEQCGPSPKSMCVPKPAKISALGIVKLSIETIPGGAPPADTPRASREIHGLETGLSNAPRTVCTTGYTKPCNSIASDIFHIC